MDVEVKVPEMGESISEAVVSALLKADGVFVQADDELIELETDKVNQLLYAPQSGILKWAVRAGETVAIGQRLGAIEVASSGATPTLLPASPEKTEQKRPMIELPVIESSVVVAQPPTYESKGEKRRKMSKIRQVIAQRLVAAQQQAAILTTFNEVDMSAISALRTKYQETFTKRHGVRLGFLSFFVKAVTAALQRYPLFNSYIDGDEIVERSDYSIGIAIATDRGLVVPVLRNCDALSLAAVESQIEALAQRARNGKLSLQELQGAGFTISNGGVYGSMLSTPLLNPPQSAILGMHKIAKRPVAVDDQVVIRPMMYLAVSYDHRLIDGKEAVLFLIHIKEQLEDPMRFLLEI